MTHPPRVEKCDCGQKALYNTTHDAYYCLFCNTWLEPACKIRGCTFCPTRPKTPFKFDDLTCEGDKDKRR